MRKPNQERQINGGVQRFYEFPNGYTASVVRHSFSYGHEQGLWELAVMHNDKLCYDTPITDDVLGRLSEAQVDEVLAKVEALPARETKA